MDRKKIKAVAVMMMLGIAMTGKAQSGVTYNHDSAKKNQMMEKLIRMTSRI